MLSRDVEKDSWNTIPWRRAGMLAAAEGMERGEALGDSAGCWEGPSRAEVVSKPPGDISGGSGVTALMVVVWRNAPRRLLAEGLSELRGGSGGGGASESGGSIEARAGRSGSGGAEDAVGLVPKE